MSLEKLDRASPDLWPEQSECIFNKFNPTDENYNYFIPVICEVPGVNEFIAQNLSPNDQSPWLSGLTPDDINQLHRKL